MEMFFLSYVNETMYLLWNLPFLEMVPPETNFFSFLKPWANNSSTNQYSYQLFYGRGDDTPRAILSQKCILSRIERDTCTPMFIAALFTIARTWTQPRCPLADEWIKKLWYIHSMEYYSDIKKNSFESVLMRWIKLQPITQSEVSQKEKHQYSILMHIYGI